VQIPYYKEGLEVVLKPTVRSLKAAIATYEMQGGTANMVVHDDGIQIISEEERAERKEFYEENNIGWTARPAHKAKLTLKGVETTFLRKGKFKKASNMNFGMWISCRVEEKLVARQLDSWTASDEAFEYQECMKEVLEEDEGTSWAEGMSAQSRDPTLHSDIWTGNIRFGDYILIIDSDTRVDDEDVVAETNVACPYVRV